MIKPFFSIVIPTLNEEKYVLRLLKSLSRQTYKNFEVLVVDGQSKDKTRNVVNSFHSKLPQLIFLTTAKRNVSYQRNFGAQKAKGNFLIFMDADIWFDQEVLAKIYYLLQKQKFDMFIPRVKFPPTKLGFKLINLGAFWLFAFAEKSQRNLGTGSFLGIKKNIFNGVKGFDVRLALSEDHQLIKKAKKAGFNLRFLKQVEVTLSPRRLEKEGVLKFLLKYLYFSIYEHMTGPIYHLPLKYHMGGEYYD